MHLHLLWAFDFSSEYKASISFRWQNLQKHLQLANVTLIYPVFAEDKGGGVKSHIYLKTKDEVNINQSSVGLDYIRDILSNCFCLLCYSLLEI